MYVILGVAGVALIVLASLFIARFREEIGESCGKFWKKCGCKRRQRNVTDISVINPDDYFLL